jgi:phosphatidylglycerophosphate synthase
MLAPNSSIAELRIKTQSRLEEPPVYRPFRAISVLFTKMLLHTNISPNQITIAWLGCLVASSILMAQIGTIYQVASIVLLLSHYVLDCCDGEVARARGKGSSLGSQLEQVAHWIGSGCLILGASWPSITSSSNHSNVIIYSLAIIGVYTFHFVFYQLMLLMAKGHNYGSIHKICRVSYTIMPLEVNLILVFLVIGRPWWGVCVWAVAGNALWITVYTRYIILAKNKGYRI